MIVDGMMIKYFFFSMMNFCNFLTARERGSIISLHYRLHINRGIVRQGHAVKGIEDLQIRIN